MAASSFNWEQLLTLADELSGRTEEECLRTSIGRAYYFAYHLAKKRITQNKFVFFKGSDTHKQVWEKFDGSPDSRCKNIALIAKFLKERRERADYDDAYPRIAEDVPLVIERARKLADALVRLDPKLPRNTGVQA